MRYKISYVGTGQSYIVSTPAEARDADDRSAVESAIALGDVVQMGCICVEPIR